MSEQTPDKTLSVRQQRLAKYEAEFQPYDFDHDPEQEPERYLAVGYDGEYWMSLCEDEQQAARVFGIWLAQEVVVRPIVLADLETGAWTREFHAVAQWADEDDQDA